MPKLPINYQKACIYEIVCKDVNITERYVGSTTNLIQRRSDHKTTCNNEKSKGHNRYVYQFIRENGGFGNWDVVLIEQIIDCKDKENLHKRERFYIEEKKAELNKQIPLRTDKEYREENKGKIKEFYENNKDKIAKQTKKYSDNNKDKIAEQRKEYRENNKDKIAEQRKEFYENNKGKIAEHKKKHYENNRDKIKEYQKIYRENNRDKIKEYQKKNQANKILI